MQNTLTKGIIVYEEVVFHLCFRNLQSDRSGRELRTLTATIKHVPLKHIQ